MNKCPICGKDRISPEALGKERELAKQHGIISEIYDPGGRLLKFPDKTIRLANECSWCDYEKLEEELSIYK